MKKQQKHYTPEEKVAILRQHLLKKEPISTLCDELGLQPTVFYRWQKEFFVLADFVDRADVGVVQGGSGACLPAEAFERLWVLSQVLGQKLQRDKARRLARSTC